MAQQGGSRLIKGLLQGVGQGVVHLLPLAVQLLRRKIGLTLALPLPQPHQGADLGQLRPPAQGDGYPVLLWGQALRVLGPLTGKEGEQHLFGGKAVFFRAPGPVFLPQPKLHFSPSEPPGHSSWSAAPAPG